MAADTDRARCGTVAGWTRDRWGLLWEGFFALTLAIPTAVAVADAPTVISGATTAATAAAFAMWHWQTALRRPHWEGRPPMLLWLAGALVFTWVLLGRHDSYLFLIYGLYPQVFGLLGRAAIPGVVVLTGLVFWRTGALAGAELSTWVVSIGGSVALAGLVGVFVTALVRQNEARKEALEALEATRAELGATARRAGMLEERERLARDLHDAIAQGFTGIVMQLEASDQVLDGDPGLARDHLDRARRSARDGLTELRRTVHALRPEALHDATLVEALDRTVRRWSEEVGIPAGFSIGGTPRPLTPDLEIALLRTAQEALANVAKHAAATEVTVRLAYHPRQLGLEVSDDGVGFDPGGPVAGDGAGLKGLAERMAAHGGQLTVDSNPSGGTTLTAQVPVP